MREITKIISVQVDGNALDFRLTKLDAFSGVSLLRIMSRLPEGGVSIEMLLTCLPEEELRSLMTVCLEHAEVLLPAGWIPVLTRGEWSFPEIACDTAICLKLTMEEAVWTLEGFFGGGASGSRSEIPAT